LYGSLLTHEPKVIAANPKAQGEPKRKKDIAFTSDIAHNIEVSDSEETIDDDDDFALLTKRFKKFMKKNKNAGKRFTRRDATKTDEKNKDTNTCFECKKPGYYPTIVHC
ncbi:hypothetical protein DVA76_17520, partial [Acinetobacter baumannii]